MSCNCNEESTPLVECSCKVRLNSDCITVSGIDTTCSGISDNLILTDYLTRQDAYVCSKFDSISGFTSLRNVGVGAEVYKGVDSIGRKEIRKIKSSDSSVTITQGTDDINLSVVVPNGTETKVVAGTNTTVTGTGTVSSPYVINASSTSTSYSAGNGLALTGTTFSNSLPDQIVTLTQGGATTITGSYPNFTISSINTIADGSETKINSGATTIRNGLGTIANPYTIETVNLQKEIVSNYTLTNADNEYTIFINNSAPVTITLNTTVTIPNFCVGFIQEGVGDVTFASVGHTLTNPIGLKSKGAGYQTFIERKLNTTTFYLLGNTRA